MNKEWILIKEHEFRAYCSLGNDEPVNIKQLLLKLNILTLYKPAGETFSGMCLKRGENRFVLVNSNHPRSRQHFTIAHELYHLFIQKDFKTHLCNPGFSKQPQEQEADFFASVFLMPEMGVKRMIPEKELLAKDVSIATILKLEHYFSVSRSALLIRLEALKLIGKERYEVLKAIPVTRSAVEYGYDSSLYLPGNENLVIGDYGVKAKLLFDDDKISEGHYIELLSKIGIDPTEQSNEENVYTFCLRYCLCILLFYWM